MISAAVAGSLAMASTMGAVRRHCQTMAFMMGSPVARSHTMVVSRWLAMPMAAISSAVAPILFMAERATPSWVVQISLASCSTQPGLGKYWVNSFWATLQILPSWSNRIQRFEVVPASSAIMYFFIRHFLWRVFAMIKIIVA